MSTTNLSICQLIRQHHPYANVDIYCVSNQHISTIAITIIILLSINTFPLAYSVSSNFQPSQKANDSDNRWGKILITDWILLNPKMKTTKMAEITCIIFWKTCPTGQCVYHNFYNMNDVSGIHLQRNQLKKKFKPSWKHRCRKKAKTTYRCKMLKCAVKASARG